MPDADAAPAREPLPVLPTDVWQIIACFAQPVSAAATRHLAAPARALDEHVQYKLDGNKDEWHERTHAQNDVDQTQRFKAAEHAAHRLDGMARHRELPLHPRARLEIRRVPQDADRLRDALRRLRDAHDRRLRTPR